MDTQGTINLIKDSFEIWYNKTFAKESPVSVVINYSDKQMLSIKAFHTITIELSTIGIKGGMSYTRKLISIQENYNHGITSEEEAKEGLIKRMLTTMYGFKIQ